MFEDLKCMDCLSLGVIQSIVVNTAALDLDAWSQTFECPVATIVPEVPTCCQVGCGVTVDEDCVVEVRAVAPDTNCLGTKLGEVGIELSQRLGQILVAA